MKILVTHECSGVVREAARALGHDAWSCDLKPSEDGSPCHIQGDALEALRMGWDYAVMHPECTYLNGAGIHWNNRGRGWDKTNAALAHVQNCMDTATEFVRLGWAMENPVGLISTRIRKANQYVQPYQFGDDASKKTGLWLWKLPCLVPTTRIPGRIVLWQGKSVERWANQTDSGQNRLGPSQTRAADRSRTYPGLARAMSSQWFSSSVKPLSA